MFRQVNPKQSFPEMEAFINEFWKKNDTFNKSISIRSEKDRYVFYDGPPFITGTPHYGTLLSRIAKDVVPRYWTMNGKRVDRQWGWDCHGLPIETKVEKNLGIKNRREIESYGVGRFIDECYKYTREVSAEWKWYKEKVGQWVDFDNSYKTMDQSYMETVMWVFKQLMENGHIYEGVRTSLYCNRCGTPVSNFEIAMDNSYTDMEDPAVTVKFPIVRDGDFKGISVLAWTTTPWTMPSNRALVIDPKEDYVVVETQKESIEFEQTWLVENLPSDFEKCKKIEIEQGFLKNHPDKVKKNFRDARIRNEDNTRFTLTTKFYTEGTNEFGQLTENTKEITKEEYEDYTKDLTGSPIHKTRYLYPISNGLTAEIDVYKNELEGLISADVEFKSVEVAENFTPPEFFTKELTDSEDICVRNLIEKKYVDVKLKLDEYKQKPHLYKSELTNDKVILAKKRIEHVLKNREYKILKEFKGTELIGLKYEPPFTYMEGGEKEWHIFAFDGMVNMEEGTGIVHSAPGFGEVDTEMGQANGLTIAMSIDDQGKFIDKVEPYKGMYIKDADKYIIEDLRRDDRLFHAEKITHRYPFCYRCATPLIQKAQPSWFINIQDMKQDMLANNEWINWVPDHLKDGRFKKGINMAPDWGISRTRFWATPMPVWQREDNGKVIERIVIGSRDELRALSIDPLTKVHFLLEGSTLKTDAEKTSELKLSDLKELEEIKSEMIGKYKIGTFEDATEDQLQEAFYEYVLALKGKLSEFLMQNMGKNLEVKTDVNTLTMIRHIAERYSLKEVFAMSYPINQPFVMFFNKADLMDLHRPKIDEIRLKGKTGELTRIKEVLDVWMDSASMPYACKHYPFEHKEEFEANYPADFVVEYIAQTRAWFYVMHVMSTALFNKHSFKNIITTGVMAGSDGRKMSKSYGNYPDPKATILKYGAEPLRLYLMGSRIMVGEDINFEEEGLKDQVKTIILPLWNSYSFLVTYANMKSWEPTEDLARNNRKDPRNTTTWDHIPYEKIDNKLDQWIIAKLQLAIRDYKAGMEEYNIPSAVKVIPAFIDDLSKWYIRRSRNRFANGEKSAFDTLYYVIVEFAKLMAPVTPFLSEEIYQNLVSERIPDQIESVHLCDFPAYDLNFLDNSEDVLTKMEEVQKIVTLGQSIRVDNSLKVRQPLPEIQVENRLLEDWMKALISEELNIKAVNTVGKIIDADGWIDAKSEDDGLKTSINTNLSDEMKYEGIVREIIRGVQNIRKKDGLQMGDKIAVEIAADDEFVVQAIGNNTDMLSAGINASQLTFNKGTIDGGKQINVNKSIVYVKLVK